MNYLAHAWLWPDDEQTLAGSLFGDFIHGRLPPDMPERLAQAIMLHRRIDRATDTFPAVVSLRAQMPAHFRRYGGIVLDMGFDHILARDFAEWSSQPLRAFASRVYCAVARYRHWIPEQKQPRIDYLLGQKLLERYDKFEEVVSALAGIGTRLNRQNPLHESGPILVALLPELSAVLPSLLLHLQQQRSHLQLTPMD